MPHWRFGEGTSVDPRVEKLLRIPLKIGKAGSPVLEVIRPLSLTGGLFLHIQHSPHAFSPHAWDTAEMASLSPGPHVPCSLINC